MGSCLYDTTNLFTVSERVAGFPRMRNEYESVFTMRLNLEITSHDLTVTLEIIIAGFPIMQK